MKIIIENINREFIKLISLQEIETLKIYIGEISSFKKPVNISIYALNEKINCYELIKFTEILENFLIVGINIFSNVRETILAAKSLKINSTYLNHKDLQNELLIKINRNPENVFHKGTIRSGDRISSNGDLFIVGDVNPGAIVSAKQNVYVWGKLLGIAFAGEGGNKSAYIASLHLNPLQLRISGIVAIGPKEKPINHFPEIAVLEKNLIIIKPHLIERSKKINNLK